jgi:uncharacterized membrane protein YedE/YeeE
MESFVYPLIGGALIGLASIGLLLFNGRIAGISGIFGGLLGRISADALWKVAFVAGLVAGGLVLRVVLPQAFESSVVRSLPALLVAGFLVGFGTRLGSGCTSGHGVCGLSRFSPRSLVAVLSFIGAGVAVVFIVSRVFGGVL